MEKKLFLSALSAPLTRERPARDPRPTRDAKIKKVYEKIAYVVKML